MDALRIEKTQLRARMDASAVHGGASSASMLDASRRPAAASGMGGRSDMHGVAESADTPYGHAIRMAREGRAVAEVAGDCGISRGEAELIVALYRSSSTH